MQARVVHRYENHLPADDDHPYRTGAWRPQLTEWDATDLDVIEGTLPADFAGTYLRNTENPLLPAIGRYHPFDGDGMLHAIRFADGKASYRNRMVRTVGLAAELEAKQPLWAGIIEAPAKSARDGWGARGRMKDASSTDVIVHAGSALTTFYQCGDVYAQHPETLAAQPNPPWAASFGNGMGISAHPKLDEHTNELLVFGYGTQSPFMSFGVVDSTGALVHQQPIPLPGPRLPHDMAFTEHYAILNDCPLFWDADGIGKGVYRPRWHPELPLRLGVVPRRGGDVQWFEAAATYVLHWINAYEDGNTIVLDGFFQEEPMPKPDPADGPWAGLRKLVDVGAVKAKPHRWRLDLATGKVTEERLFDRMCEFGTIHGRYGGRRNRYAFAMTTKPGWFLFDGMVRFDLESGATQQFRWADGVYGSEAPIAPRTGATAEDDGYVVTFVTDTNRDASECQIFDAKHLDAGPIARVALPERICTGTHACWTSL